MIYQLSDHKQLWRILNHETERNAENHETERNIRITERDDMPTAIILKPPGNKLKV